VFSVQQILAQKSITEMEHPPCSLDLALNGFWLFPKIVCLTGTEFQDIEDIQRNVMMVQRTIPQQVFTQMFSNIGGIIRLLA
jgi:hypothetical protein